MKKPLQTRAVGAFVVQATLARAKGAATFRAAARKDSAAPDNMLRETSRTIAVAFEKSRPGSAMPLPAADEETPVLDRNP